MPPAAKDWASIVASSSEKSVERKESSFAVLRVWGDMGGLRIVGMPDHIVWSEGKPLWLVELKTTRGNLGSLWPDQANQVRIYALLLEAEPRARGWLADVLRCVERLYSTFTLENVYPFEAGLVAKHPKNRNVRPKIRQQLQVLRDLGLVEFVTPGVYRRLR